MHEKKPTSLPSYLFVPVFLLILSSPALSLEAADGIPVMLLTQVYPVLRVIETPPPVSPG